jgi:tetratricopeptide (TPR) repeat protein
MNQQIPDIDLIQRYLDRTLTDAEKANLEERLKNEPVLKTMYLEHQQLIKGIRYSYLQTRLQQLRMLENTMPQMHNEKRNKQVWLVTYWKQTAAIAATVALFAIGFLLWNKPATPEELYAEHFKIYPNVFEPITRGENKPSMRTEAFAAYEAGNYAQAAALFNRLLAEKEEAGVLMLLGNCNLVLGNTAEARSQFIRLINDFDDLDNQAKWYLGLSYLKDGDLKTAQLILQELSNSEYSYAARARKLLNDIN